MRHRRRSSSWWDSCCSRRPATTIRHITCWPAYTLSHFGQILNYNGDRVEQSSSLLQVLLLARARQAHELDLVTLAKLSSIAFGIASLLVLFTLVARVAGRAAGVCAALIAAVSIPIVYWSFSGMETSLVSLTGLCVVLTTADYIAEHAAAALWKADAGTRRICPGQAGDTAVGGVLPGERIRGRVRDGPRWRFARDLEGARATSAGVASDSCDCVRRSVRVSLELFWRARSAACDREVLRHLHGQARRGSPFTSSVMPGAPAGRR